MENNGLRYGGILGLIYIVVLMLLYLIDPSYLFNSILVVLFTIFLFCIGAYFSINKEREVLGGFIEFQPAFKIGFITVFTISTISCFFTYLLFNFIDPSLIDLGRDYQIEQLTSGWVGEKLTEEEKAEMIRELGKKEELPISSVLLKIAMYTILGSFFAAITASFVNNPAPENDAEDVNH